MLKKCPWGRGIGTIIIDRVTNQQTRKVLDDSGRLSLVQQ